MNTKSTHKTYTLLRKLTGKSTQKTHILLTLYWENRHRNVNIKHTLLRKWTQKSRHKTHTLYWENRHEKEHINQTPYWENGHEKAHIKHIPYWEKKKQTWKSAHKTHTLLRKRRGKSTTHLLLGPFRVENGDLHGALAGWEGFHSEASGSPNLVALGLQTGSIGTHAGRVDTRAGGSPGFQLGVGELGQVGHHGQVVHLGVGHLVWLDQLSRHKAMHKGLIRCAVQV